MDLARMAADLEELQKKAIRYDNLMARAVEFSEKLSQAAELLNEVAKELNPTMPGTRGPRQNYEEIADDIYIKMQAGLEVGTDFLIAAYPEWPYHKVMALIRHLQGRPNVTARKEKGKLYIYCKKEFR